MSCLIVLSQAFSLSSIKSDKLIFARVRKKVDDDDDDDVDDDDDGGGDDVVVIGQSLPSSVRRLAGPPSV